MVLSLLKMHLGIPEWTKRYISLNVVVSANEIKACKGTDDATSLDSAIKFVLIELHDLEMG